MRGEIEQFASVGRPAQRPVEMAVIGQLPGGPAAGGLDVDIPHGVVEIADAVEAVDRACDEIRIAGIAGLGVYGRGEGDGAAVGGPDRLPGCALLQRGELPRFAASNRQQEDLLLAAAVGQEGDLAAIRRPGGRSRVVGRLGQPALLARIQIDQPERRGTRQAGQVVMAYIADGQISRRGQARAADPRVAKIV